MFNISLDSDDNLSSWWKTENMFFSTKGKLEIKLEIRKQT